MAKKRKNEPRKLTDLPPRPPQDLHEAVLFGAASEVTEDVLQAYVNTVYQRPSRMTKKVRTDGTVAILKLATVGFSFINWYRDRPR